MVKMHEVSMSEITIANAQASKYSTNGGGKKPHVWVNHIFSGLTREVKLPGNCMYKGSLYLGPWHFPDAKRNLTIAAAITRYVWGEGSS